MGLYAELEGTIVTNRAEKLGMIYIVLKCMEGTV